MSKSIFTLRELAELRVLNKRKDKDSFNKYYEKASDKIKTQFNSGEYKEIKVFLRYNEVNDYQELWQVVGEERYYSRYTAYHPSRWYYVCDPLGYAELDREVPGNVMFVVCNEDGEPLFGSSNVFGAVFPTFEEMCHLEWGRIKNDYPHFKDNTEADFWSQYLGQGTTISADRWLLTFKDPEIYGDAAKDYDENWIYHKKIVEDQAISSFSYLGRRYGIFKVTYEQENCKKHITEYWVAGFRHYDNGEESSISMDRENMCMFLDSYFKGEPGTMYLKRDAIEVVAESLKEIYGNKPISEIHDSYGFVYERFMSYPQAAERILDHNWNRKHVEEILKAEKYTHHFWAVDDPKIDEVYPNCVRDSKFNYDFAGRRIA